MPTQSRRPLKVGLVLPIAEEWMAGETALWKDMKAMALHAEAVGFDSIWINDHLIFQFGEPGEPMRGTWECWSLLSALAAVASRVEIAPSWSARASAIRPYWQRLRMRSMASAADG